MKIEMRDFFIQCLKDLESLTGLRQLFFLQSDLQDGERKKNVLIEGMILVAKKFDYIPEEEQKKIISRMMVEDQDYDSLNSRVIWKWLNLHKDKYFEGQSHYEEINTKPAPPEVADKYIEQVKESLKQIGNPQIVNGLKKLREESGVKSIPREPRKLFKINGYEVYATTEAEALKAYHATEEKLGPLPQRDVALAADETGETGAEGNSGDESKKSLE